MIPQSTDKQLDHFSPGRDLKGIDSTLTLGVNLAFYLTSIKGASFSAVLKEKHNGAWLFALFGPFERGYAPKPKLDFYVIHLTSEDKHWLETLNLGMYHSLRLVMTDTFVFLGAEWWGKSSARTGEGKKPIGLLVVNTRKKIDTMTRRSQIVTATTECD